MIQIKSITDYFSGNPNEASRSFENGKKGALLIVASVVFDYISGIPEVKIQSVVFIASVLSTILFLLGFAMWGFGLRKRCYGLDFKEAVAPSLKIGLINLFMLGFIAIPWLKGYLVDPSTMHHSQFDQAYSSELVQLCSNECKISDSTKSEEHCQAYCGCGVDHLLETKDIESVESIYVNLVSGPEKKKTAENQLASHFLTCGDGIYAQKKSDLRNPHLALGTALQGADLKKSPGYSNLLKGAMKNSDLTNPVVTTAKKRYEAPVNTYSIEARREQSRLEIQKQIIRLREQRRNQQAKK